MKNLLITFILAFGLLVFGWYVFERTVEAQTNVAVNLFGLPAPPPPNPFFKGERSANAALANYDSNNPPPDDAPDEDFFQFWEVRSGMGDQTLTYKPEPSEHGLQRIYNEIEKNPERLNAFINVLPDTPETTDFARRVLERYPQQNTDSEDGNYGAEQIKDWLNRHSPAFADALLPSVQAVGDTSTGYVSNQEDLLALARVNWEKARPFVERLYNDSSQPISQTLARWAFYQHALREGSSIDADRYRRELMDRVEDRSAKPGERDLAMDALVTGGDFSGRDDWYFSLLEDETLHDLRVGGQTYTGLTTLINVSKPGKYTDKMIELLGTASPVARGAIARNLALMLNDKNPAIVKALLPWLENPKWAKDVNGERHRLVETLTYFKMPESVPGLIQMLNEKADVSDVKVTDYSSNRMMDNRMMDNRMISNQMMSDLMTDSPMISPYDEYPFRRAAVGALVKQRDYRAAGALRQILPEVEEYERGTVVQAILYSGGFSISEQITALEATARNLKDQVKSEQESAAAMAREQILSANRSPETNEDNESETNSYIQPLTSQMNTYTSDPPPPPPPGRGYAADDSVRVKRPITAEEMSQLLGSQLVSFSDPPDELVAAVAERIARLESSEPLVAAAMRQILQNWNGQAINALMLKDLKNGKTDIGAVVKLLGLRKEMREKQSENIYDSRSANNPLAVGVAACLLEDAGEYEAILSGANEDAKIALLGCARLIRAKLPLDPVAENFKSPNKFLQKAAELYLESEDSFAARSTVLARHSGEAKILGARMAFQTENSGGYFDVSALYSSVDPSLIYLPYYEGEDKFQKSESLLQKEVKTDENLLGVYSYDGNFVRFYKDRIMFSWEDDANAARYRERRLTDYEFNRLKDYLVAQRVDDLPPFLSYCDGCIERELIMLGRQGGRRVYMRSERIPEFFSGLDEIFKEMRKPAAKLHYYLEKDTAGLEILFADENLQAQTVWKDGEDLRVLIADQQRREQIDAELNRLYAEEQSKSDEENFDYEKFAARQEKQRRARAYEHLAWYRLEQNGLGAIAAQPALFDSIPRQDGQNAPASDDQWKARAGGIEIRADAEGLYKLSGGRLTKIGDGVYQNPVISADGRWALVTKYVEGEISLERVNLSNNRSAPVALQGAVLPEVLAFVSSVGKFLIYSGSYEDYEYINEGGREMPEMKRRNGSFFWLDAATGAAQPVKGELRPLAQQTFRPLQSNGATDEFWAAIPDENYNYTQIGIYNAKTFVFQPALKVPRILFDSMQMWVDAASKKVYFVYNGQLLALPLK